MRKTKMLFEDFQQAVLRLEEALNEPHSAIVRDSSIKRFEIAYELAWKTLKYYFEESQKDVVLGSKDIIRRALKAKLISYDDYWMQIIEMRNRTVHTYDLTFVQELYENDLPKILQLFKELEKNISFNLIKL